MKAMKPINDLNASRRTAAFRLAAQLPTASQREQATVEAIERYPVIDSNRSAEKTDPETIERMNAAFGLARVPKIEHSLTRSTYRHQESH